MIDSGGGAATSSGIDYQQRVAATFVLHMGLGLDCSSILERLEDGLVTRVAFETADCIDDIVLTHENSKSYIQVKRKLSFSKREGSEFYKVVDQFVRQFKFSQNTNDSFVLITSSDSSNTLSKELRKITKSCRLSKLAVKENPLTKLEKSTYDGLLSCIKSSAEKNGYAEFSQKEILQLVKQIHVVILDVEQDGAYEKALLATLENRFVVSSILVWKLLISQTLDWSKNRQSVDVGGVGKLFEKFRKVRSDKSDEKLDNYFKIEFEQDNYEICSGREVVIVDSISPEFDFSIIELYRFDDNGNFRIKFHESYVEMGDGTKYKLYGRFSTYVGVERFLQDNPKFKNAKLLFVPINSDYAFDQCPVAKAYSDKVRKHILENNQATSCIHCQHGLTPPSLLVEVQEEGLPFDAGSIHYDCLRESDRILGVSKNEYFEESDALRDFDFNKWISLLPKSQGLWAGSDRYFSGSIQHIAWNSDPVGDARGAFCIKVLLKDGSHQYVSERGRVQRYNKNIAEDVCDRLNGWIADSIAENNPLCYSSDGNLQGVHNDLQEKSNAPLDLVECESFNVVKFTRGISVLHDKLNNFYAPLIAFVDKDSGDYLVCQQTMFLLTNPFDFKIYLKNWNDIGYTLDSFRFEIIESDKDFDSLMSRTMEHRIQVLVDPFFNSSKNLIKGSVVEDFRQITEGENNEEAERFSLLFTTVNEDGSFTHLFRDFIQDITLILYDKCTSGDCRCMGCQIYDSRVKLYGSDNLELKQSNEKTTVLNVSDGEIEWDNDFLNKNSVLWEEWEPIVT